MLKLLIVGATSAIAQETARFFAADGAEMFLVSLEDPQLVVVADDLRARGAKMVTTYELDVTRKDEIQPMIDTALDVLGGLDAVLIAHGTLGDQEVCQQDVDKALWELDVNFLSVVALLTPLANYFEEQRRGCIAVISSVAGDRGRMSNYVYGTAKAGVTTFMQGLRHRLSKSGVSVLTIKPGLVDTPMTAHLKKNFMYASPHRVGKAIYQGMKKGKSTIYVPWYWWPIMKLIIHTPGWLFHKTKL